ncbi:hypothetical protein AMATHDRAFT_45361 [Amanita thiersii Skay4041]|uniref:Protein YOP1 n=1 Tax=Amanita thiersii Skay4041 TaxID=703135 RepID=A0A2A9NZG3_9AGAR|nr:hypothetical protein AMATHDRAFT_45361 [Amanita thiersii Skay4041]
MLFFLTSRLISSVAAFLYPGYASYKTLSQRPASEEELERWLMYWSVLGCIVGIEYVAEWLISWIPFYYTLKTIFLLYLALPQTRGSSYIYINHLSPFFHSHERQIDAALASLRAKIYAFVQERLKALWEQFSPAGQQQAAFDPAGRETSSGTRHAAPGPAQLVSSFWRSYGPGILASGAALLRQTTGGSVSTFQPAAQTAMHISPESRGTRRDNQQSVEDRRRRRLESELASLSEQQHGSMPIPGASPGFAASRGSSDSDVRLRERANSNTSGGRFEEVEVPSDVEGYDVDDDEREVGRAQPGTRSSWFGWGGQTKGYERLKNE